MIPIPQTHDKIVIYGGSYVAVNIYSSLVSFPDNKFLSYVVRRTRH